MSLSKARQNKSSSPPGERIEVRGQSKKLLEKLLPGRSDANIRFDDLRNLLASLGFGGIWQSLIRFERFDLSLPSMD
jgi:hypothetical protein